MFSSPLDDDDGDFMSPPTRSSSKLASLFGQDKASFSGGNESLTYTPPKQPKKEKPAGQSQGGGGETTLLCATAVHAYKYVNGQYASQGKLGAAILANHAANDYRILIYASKQQQVTTGKINGNFSFTVQGSNYASFYDDQRQTWSLCFDSDKSITNFAKQVGLSKFNSSSTSLCTQDLVPGEGLAIELGDALEVKYTGWLWKNNNFGSVFDGNVETDKTFKFKTGKGKVIKGWEQGVIGMKKGSKRLIAIPSPLAYGEKGVSGRVPPNSSLLFEVEVLRIKSSRESTESPVTIQEGVNPQSSDQLPDILSEPSGTRKRSMDSVSQLSAPGDSGIKGRTASITEQLSQSPEKGTDKARLLARMSKMGKNPLSLPGAVVAEPENDDLVEADQEVPPSPQPVVQDTRSGTSTESPPDISSNPHPSPRVKPQPPPRPVQVHPEVQQTLHNPTPGMHNPTPGMQPIMNHQPMISPQHVMNPQPVIQPAFTPQQQVALYQPPTSSMGYPMMAPQPQIITAAPYSVPPPPPPPPQPQPTANDAMVPVLMAETRQQQGEIRMSIAKLSDKIDELSNKVDRQHQSSVQVANQLSPANQMGVSAYGNPQAVMEASILVHNITRIVQENEKLKVESTEKTKKIEVLNDKISELLQKSQRFVEHSNTMLEQRSDSLQVNTAQSQARVLSLEQEKISMSGELTTAKTQLAALLNEVTSLRQREAEVSSQLSKVTSEAEKFKNELERTKDSHTESAEQSERLKQSLKEEKQTRKQFETKVEHMEEELNDLRNEKESLEKVLGERKKKHAADKKKCEEELEELRSQQEEEIKFLKEKHKKEKQSSGTATAQQVAQAEAELEERWSEKAERMVAQTEQKWKRRLQEVTDEREEANKKLLELQGKYSAMKASEDSKEEKIKDLGDKLEDLEGIQEKYAQLQASNVDKESEVDALRSTKQELESLQTKYQEVRSRTLKMKEQYEEQLNTAEEERESAVSEAYAKGLREGKVQGGGNTQESSVNVNDEVKRIMNTVFYMLRNEFEAGESYSGADIMNVVLKTIKEVTMKLLSGKPAEKEESEEEEEEEEEDDENEDEDENEDVKVEIEEKEVSKEEDEKVEEKEELKVEQEEVTQGEGDSGKVGNNKDAEEEFGENSQKEVLEEVDKGESGDEDTSAEKDTEESEFLRGIPDANVETKSVEKESSQVNLETSSEDRADEKDSPSLGNTINSVPLQGNEIDVRSLEEPSAAVTDENSRTEVDRTSSEFATSLRVENEEGSPFDGLIGEESQPTTEAEEKEESFFDAQEEPVKAGTQMDSSKTTDISEDKLKSLFGDDDHDDVEATFGSLTKKKEKEEHLDTSPLRAVPPPLFDDDDDDDDLDWFK